MYTRRRRKVETWRRIYLFVGTPFGNSGTFLVISFVRDLRDENVVGRAEETQVYAMRFLFIANADRSIPEH